MNEISDSKTSRNKKNNDSIKNIQKSILDLVKRSKYGLNISDIARKLKISRNTVKANVELLEEEGKILIKQIGRSRICYFQKFFDVNQTFRPFVFNFFNQILDSFEATMKSHVPNSEELVKDISRNFGKNLDLPPFQFLKLDAVKNLKSFTLDDVVETLLQFFEMFTALNLKMKAEIIPPEIDSSRIIRLELLSDEVGKSIFFYHVCAGFFESKLNIFYKTEFSLDVIDFRKESSCCYFRLKKN